MKLLLRVGIIYYDGDAWTGKRDAWLRQQALPVLDSRATRLTFDSDYNNVLTVKVHRDRLDAATGSTPRSARRRDRLDAAIGSTPRSARRRDR